MANNIWVFCEQRDGEIQAVALELLGVARELAEKTNEKVCAMLLGSGVADKANQLIAYGADQVHVVDDESLKLYEEGCKLAKTCLKDLEKAKGKIIMIKKDFNEKDENNG